MPEKTIETNNAMPKTPEKVEETARRYMREAETTARDAFRTYNDLMTTTTDFYFDAFGKIMRHNMELTRQTQDNLENMMTIYRRMYSDNYKAWEGYWDDVNKMIPRPR